MPPEKAALFAYAIRDVKISLMKAIETGLPWELNLTGDQALFLCSFSPGSWVSASEAKRANGINNPSYPLAQLVVRGLLTSKVPVEDKRVVIYQLTPAGVEAKKLISSILVDTFSSLNELDITEGVTLLGEVKLRLDAL